ncbi:MAG: hypothetical protein HRT81_05120 [Henriciella sp.]|nr:hypothetical protein [Henriciella sp.]
MRDLREDLEPVWRATARISPAEPGGRVLMFTSARVGEGVTSMAASFACMAARRAEKPVWLVDLDLRRNPIIQGFQDGFARDVGGPGRAYDASLRQQPFYSISPAVEGKRQDKLLTAHDIERLPLLVTRFRGERLQKGQKVRTRTAPEWWQTLRGLCSYAIIDGPALERSSAALNMAPIVDGVILVVTADQTTPQEIEAARREIESRQGRVLGVVMNRIRGDARFAERFSA